MRDRIRVDEATLLWAAATVTGIDPADLATTVDVGVLTSIVAAADGQHAVESAAAAVLVGVITEQPFPTSNGAAGWLAATQLLAEARCRIHADPAHIVALCERIRDHDVDLAGATTALRRWLTRPGAACPACGRRVYVLEVAARRTLMPGSGRFELTARCAFEHGTHDRAGRPPAAADDDDANRVLDDGRQPVLARGACGSFLVADGRTAFIVRPTDGEPARWRVVEVDAETVRPADLVGRWDELVHRGRTVGFVTDAALDLGGGDDHVDLRRLRRAIDLVGAGT